MKINSHEESRKFRELDKAYHLAYIQYHVDVHGFRGLARIINDKFPEDPISYSWIIKALGRDRDNPDYYMSQVRLSEKIWETFK
ncbi:hypothetical protein [Leptospira andrefontaineae]|uniref:Uncharacterized protein n=1 Tax=Leptospira andrefontaineae TaxID=2484976 RepID=A0A4R9GWW9_9LEPT|nr:hypothetical protein [Leptospira andrefontaineae]TGK36265.1 hypothetical protein EHO65_18365 [Leptospira andrefontaineae]